MLVLIVCLLQFSKRKMRRTWKETFQLFCRHSSIPYGAQLSNSASVRFNLYISISVYTVVWACVSCSFSCCVNHVQFAPCSQALMIDAFIWTAEEKRSPFEISVFWVRPICRAWSELMYNSAPPHTHTRLLSTTMMFWSLLTPASFILLPLICLFGVNYPPPFDFLVYVRFYFFGVSIISFFLLLSFLCCRPLWFSGFRSAFSQCHQDWLSSDWRYCTFYFPTL